MFSLSLSFDFHLRYRPKYRERGRHASWRGVRALNTDSLMPISSNYPLCPAPIAGHDQPGRRCIVMVQHDGLKVLMRLHYTNINLSSRKIKIENYNML